ncbi:hypothetical protein J2T13_003080 [Paenibacillus sp. DS2015]
MMKQQQPHHYHTNAFAFALELGFFAGIIWGAVHWLCYSLKFTMIIPAFLAEPFFKHVFLKTGAGHLIGWLFFIFMSIIATIIYVLIFRKMKGPWPGLAYGVLWWIILFVAVGPFIDLVKPITVQTIDSIITEFCLFMLWGLFIGYTVAMEFTDERMREPKKVGN